MRIGSVSTVLDASSRKGALYGVERKQLLKFVESQFDLNFLRRPKSSFPIILEERLFATEYSMSASEFVGTVSLSLGASLLIEVSLTDFFYPKLNDSVFFQRQKIR